MEIIVALFLFIYLLASFLIGNYAAQKGRSRMGFCLLSLATSPILGFIVVCIISPDESRMPGVKKCPQCAEMVKIEASVCRFCRFEFQGSVGVDASPSIRKAEPMSLPSKFLIASCALAAITFAVYLGFANREAPGHVAAENSPASSPVSDAFRQQELAALAAIDSAMLIQSKDDLLFEWRRGDAQRAALAARGYSKTLADQQAAKAALDFYQSVVACHSRARVVVAKFSEASRASFNQSLDAEVAARNSAYSAIGEKPVLK